MCATIKHFKMAIDIVVLKYTLTRYEVQESSVY